MKWYEAITLIAILIGPILAVLVQLMSEKRRRTRDQQTQTMRMLVSTRHMASDPAYSTAINMIPIDFNKNRQVMNAHREYIRCITYQPTLENAATHEKKIVTQQTKLIFEMVKSLGYILAETDIQTTAYAAGGFVARDNLMLDAWLSWPRIANALEAQVKLYAPNQIDEKEE